MRLANVGGRAVIVTGNLKGIDVQVASAGKFGPELQALYGDWDSFLAWSAELTAEPDVGFTEAELKAPSPTPGQIFAIGLNFAKHAAESGFGTPDTIPPVFTKYLSCLAGPNVEVPLPTDGKTDWEVELVAVIGRRARLVDPEDGWSCVAGLTVGQDLSERSGQLAGPAPQFSLAKSHQNFGPTGPWLVTADELADPDDLSLTCSVNGEVVQDGRTRDLLFSVPRLVAALSRVVTLYPGDIIFTGTPEGVGMGRTPQRFLRDGDELVSRIEGIGEIRQRLVAIAKRR